MRNRKELGDYVAFVIEPFEMKEARVLDLHNYQEIDGTRLK